MRNLKVKVKVILIIIANEIETYVPSCNHGLNVLFYCTKFIMA